MTAKHGTRCRKGIGLSCTSDKQLSLLENLVEKHLKLVCLFSEVIQPRDWTQSAFGDG